jgi:CHAD domain-containing protein
MAYQLGQHEQVSAGVRRMAVEQIDSALEALNGRAAGIHTNIHVVRQSAKRIRALLGLARAEIGQEAYGRETRSVREASHQLSAARDAAVMVETLERLARLFQGQLTRTAFGRVRRTLAGARDGLVERLVHEERVLEKTSELLEAARERLLEWTAGEDRFGSVRQGLERCYRAGRKGLRTVERNPSPNYFHEWRKPVKRLFHQLQVISPIWPGPVGALAKEFHVLSDQLNENHDLAILRERLLAPDVAIDPRDREALVALIDERCGELQEDVMRLGELLYAEKPCEFVDRLGIYWHAWRPANGAKRRKAA